MATYLMGIDAGTTGIRALIYDENAAILAQAYTEFPQYHPAPDRVEQEPSDIWDATQAMIRQALDAAETRLSQAGERMTAPRRRVLSNRTLSKSASLNRTYSSLETS